MSQTTIALLDGPNNSTFTVFNDSLAGSIGIRRTEATGAPIPDPVFCHRLCKQDREGFAALIEAFPGYFFGQIPVDARTTEVLFAAMLAVFADCTGSGGFFASTRRNQNGGTSSLSVHSSYGMISIDYDTEPSGWLDNGEHESEARRFGNGWIVLPKHKIGGMVAIFTYDRLETDDFGCYPSDLITRQEATGSDDQYRDQKIITRMTDEWIIAHDAEYRYFRIWQDGKFELLSTLEALTL